MYHMGIMTRNQDHDLYHIWESMRRRCNSKNHGDYKNYGARGITVCTRWDDFKTFVADVGDRPTPKHTLDRMDNDGNYEPGNVRWATRKEQAANRRKAILMANKNKPDKPVKDRYVGARVDPIFGGELNSYLENLDDTTMGDLIRKALKEYMFNHPVKGAVHVDPSLKALAGQE